MFTSCIAELSFATPLASSPPHRPLFLVPLQERYAGHHTIPLNSYMRPLRG